MLGLSICGLLSLAWLASSSIIPQVNPPFQTIPATGKPDNTFNNGVFHLKGEPKVTTDIPPAVYGARSIDLPFGRLYHGNMKFFSEGQLNTPGNITDEYMPGIYDSANQSACGIPDNAFHMSKVAIHPYFLKYADLSRYCIQDVCISFWKEDGKSDMILKVTDICSTDPNDPTHCATPADIKVDRSKVAIMEGMTHDYLTSYPQLAGSQFPEKTWWFFAKCWADALAQPAYQGPPANNWFTTPHLPNNIKWAQSTAEKQYKNNQVAYAAKGWPTYPQGLYNTRRDETTSPPITDWVPGTEPAWTPIAGGKGWGLGTNAPEEESSRSSVPSEQAETAVPQPSAPPSAPSVYPEQPSAGPAKVVKQKQADPSDEHGIPAFVTTPTASATSKSSVSVESVYTPQTQASEYTSLPSLEQSTRVPTTELIYQSSKTSAPYIPDSPTTTASAASSIQFYPAATVAADENADTCEA